MILTVSPLPPPPLPVSAVEPAASLAQAVSEERASRPAAAREICRGLAHGVHVLVKGGAGKG
jgi:hypothetical protein